LIHFYKRLIASQQTVMGSSFYESLPQGWKTICTKGHAEEHSRKCFNWISPQGRKYREWPEVQAYFQLQNFESDIPGLECRGENVLTNKPEKQENVTLEEVENLPIGKSKTGPGLGKRKKKLSTIEEDNTGAPGGEDRKEEEEPKPRKRGRKKKEEVDEEYVPGMESKKTPKKKKTPIKKKVPQESKPAASPSLVKEPTLDETPDISDKRDQSNNPELEYPNVAERLKVSEVKDVTTQPAKLPVSTLSSPKGSLGPKVNSDRTNTKQAAAQSTSKVRQQTPSQVASQIRQQTPNGSQIRQQTPNTSQIRQQTPNASQIRQQTPNTSQIRQQTPNISQTRQQTPNASQIRQQTPKASQLRQQTPNTSKIRSQPPNTSQLRQQTPRQMGTQIRPATPTQGTSRRPQVPTQGTPIRPQTATQGTPIRPQTPLTPASSGRVVPAGRTGTPQVGGVRGVRAVSTPPVRPGSAGAGAGAGARQSPAVRPLAKSQAARRDTEYSELPAFLKSVMKFPSKLQTNSGGGSTLYQAAAQHCSVGESWSGLRKYCHLKMSEWWQWYQPYYTFPIQVRIKRDGGQAAGQLKQRTISSPPEFLKFLKTEESLHSFYLSECELYCLANILGITIHILTFTGQDKQAKWETFEPHQGLIHDNKFAGTNKLPMYCLHEEKVRFNRVVKL